MMVYTTTKSIKKSWSEYDQSVARCDLLNFGVIFLDCFGKPIDDEYMLEDIYTDYASKTEILTDNSAAV